MLKRFGALSRIGKSLVLGVVGFAVMAGLSASTSPPPAKPTRLDSQATTQKSAVLGEQSAPATTTKHTTETQVIPFATTTVTDTTLPKGQTKITQAGVAGVETFTYQVTYTNGIETGRQLLGQVTTTPPVNEVVTIGTYVAPSPTPHAGCNPNYSPCVPDASDVDCAGGNGNGPVFVHGPIYVIGSDIYGLDRDGDGIGCE